MSNPNDAIEIAMNNNECVQKMHLERAAAVIALAPVCDEVVRGNWSIAQAERFMLADDLKDWYRDMVDDVRIQCAGYAPRIQRGRTNGEDNYVAEYKFRDSFIGALITHSFGLINFNEYAQYVLDKYRELKSQTPRPSAHEKAKELGATIDGGINWDWAISFPSREVGEEFVKWLEANNYEHRGVYADTRDGETLATVSVRFR